MVALTFNLHGYIFQEGVNVLRLSFQSAVRALAGDIERANDEASQYQDALDQGGEWVGERDEDGYIVWDNDKVLEMRLEAAKDASMALRKAFVIAVYHHWERAVRVWTGSVHGNHEALVSLAQAKGLPIDLRLGAVRDLVNTLKHDNNKWGNALQQSWSDVFRPSSQPHPTRPDWYGAVCLTDDHVLETCDIVSASGPTAKTG